MTSSFRTCRTCGELFDLIRIQKRWTYMELALQTGLDERTIRNVLSDKVLPTLPTIDAICTALEINAISVITQYLNSDQKFTNQFTVVANSLYKSQRFVELQDHIDKIGSILSCTQSYASAVLLAKLEEFYKGLMLIEVDQFIEAKKCFNNALSIGKDSESLQTDISLMDARVLMNRELIVVLDGDLDFAMHTFEECGIILQKDSNAYCTLLFNSSNLQFLTRDFSKSLETARIGLRVAIENAHKQYIDRFYYRIGLAEYYLRKPEYIYSLFNVFQMRSLGIHSKKSDIMIRSIENEHQIKIPKYFPREKKHPAET